MITFDEFSKLDLRIGTVLSAERIPDTDKLLKLLVDFGAEQRQIISGIAEVISAEEIIGKQFPFILNLEPRIIRGVESQGMILAADSSAGAVLISPVKKVDSGSIIK